MQTADNAQFYIVAVEGWVYRDGRFLLAKRGMQEVQAAGDWALPGGKVEGENTQEILGLTLAREIREEVGVEIGKDLVLLHNHTFTRDDGSRVVMLTFLCDWTSGEAQALEDTDEVRWLTLEELLALDVKPWMRKDIEALHLHLSR